MAIKLKDIAKMAGVSEATASLALNGNKIVKDETRERIKKLAQEYGYSPNAMAKGLARRRSGTIGLIVPDIESAYYSKLVRYIDADVREAGYGLILAISNDKPEIERKIIQDFISGRVEGVVIAPVNHVNPDPGYLNHLSKHNIPFAFVSAHYPEINAGCVMVDLEEGSYKLVKYLLDLGHRSIYYLGGSRGVIITEYRVNGYLRAFEEKGLKAEDRYFIECPRLNYENSYEATERLMRTEGPIDAIITNNDMMALAAVNAIHGSGMHVPQDISVGGYDNLIFSTISSVPITTVRQDIEYMSRNVTDMLIGKINNGLDRNEKILLKPELIIRESTANRV